MKDIKVTKSEILNLSSKHLNAVISEDFYKQDSDKPFCMTVNDNYQRERFDFNFFENKDDALDHFIKLTYEVNENIKNLEEVYDMPLEVIYKLDYKKDLKL